MAIAFRASAEAHVTSGDLTITIPSGVQAGDCLLLVGGLNDAGVTANDWATPVGWTLIDSRRVGSNLFAAVYFRVAQSGDPSSTVTLPTPGTGKSCAIIAAYSGTDPVAPINVSAAASEVTSTASHTTPSATTTVDGAQVVIAAVQSDSATQSWGTASGYTKRQDSLDNVNLSGHVTATLQDKAAATVGSYGGEALVAGAASGKAAMYTIGLAPVSSTQVSRPVSDIASDGAVGVPTPGEGSGIYADLAANVDTSYAQLGDAGFVQVGMAALVDPVSGSGHTVEYRACYAAGASSGTVTVLLKQGTTTIASWEDTLTSSFADYSHTLTSGEANTITDYADLNLTFTAALA
ncbi:hypothetical protein [Actinomadura bangladeshensis]|uniref:Uncharacterized protein n=1 Tax=Actinomadura bangladeshensis TaxID=453573 RepID=A0A6L9QEG4_9ACTN|nr:hypothetical protein [Actinomadura bangladeshensis]NEA22594.1 hypothetical protein [Actinomadura bangladeshensis]